MKNEALGEGSCGTATECHGADFMMEDEHFPRSVLLVDVAGSVRLHEKLGPVEAQRAVDRCLKRVERAVDAYDGKIVRAIGDELLIVFDRADQALTAVFEMQQRIADLPAVSGIELSIRAGLAHGEVSEENESAVGEAVNVAAHLTGLAKPGQTLTSLALRDALPTGLRTCLREIGPAPAKGKFPGTTIFEALTASAAPREVPAAPAPAAPAPAAHGRRLLLRYGGELILVDDQRPSLVIGRDVENGLTIKGKRASRMHARVERRDGEFVLVDESTNGTYLTLGAGREVLLRRESRVIFGRGVICLAASAGREDVDRIEFEEL